MSSTGHFAHRLRDAFRYFRSDEASRKEIRIAGYGLLASVLLLLLDPFNLSRGMAYAGEVFGHHVAAAGKPASLASGQMLVVTADDDYLRPRSPMEQPASWPLAWPIWAEAVAAAADAGASVVLLDVVLVDERPATDVEQFVETLDRASRRSVILLATAPTHSRAFRRIHPALLALSQRNPRVRLVSVLRARGSGPFESYSAKPDDGTPSAAVAIGRAVCGRRGRGSAFCGGAPAPDAMELQWRRPPTQNCGYVSNTDEVAAGCGGLWSGGVGRLIGIMTAGTLNGAFRHGCGREGRDSCLPIAPLTFRNYPLPFASLRELLSGLPRQEADAARGGVVLIGQNFASVEDTASTPVYGTIPGVFLHGVAAENLLTPGGVWVAGTPRFLDGFSDEWADTLYVAFYILIAIPIILACRLAALRRGWSELGTGAAGLAGGLLVLAAVGIVDAALLHRGPSTWFVVLGVLALSSITAEGIAHMRRLIQARRTARRKTACG